jgi:hypothetical protein
MRKILSLGLALAWIVAGGSMLAASKKKAAAKSTSTGSKSTSKSAKSGKSAGTSKTSGKKSSSTSKGGKKSSSRKRSSATTWRNRQSAPAPERVKEIQDALVAKGYLSAEDATGSWGQPSIDALKKFQAEQNLQTTGKINSLSLIALGLGPKREPVAIPKPQEAEPPAPAQPVANPIQ